MRWKLLTVRLVLGIDDVLNTPGLRYQSLSQSSNEAWIKLYKQKSTSKNTQISYYKLGTIVCLCLDSILRSKGSSLSDILRLNNF